MIGSGCEAMMDGIEKGHGFAGERRVVVPAALLQTAIRQRPLLSGLVACGAGYFPRAAGHLRRRPQGTEEAIAVYCVKGAGWSEVDGKLHPVRTGDMLILPPWVPHVYGTYASDPWTILWLHAAGSNVGFFLEELGVSPREPLIWLGENLHVVSLFNELLECLAPGNSTAGVFHASQVLAHLFSILIRQRRQRPGVTDGIQRVAQSILYMNEHLDQPVRMTALSALANLSPAHFTVVFKQETGSAPRDYLLLLRMHRACLLLSETNLSVKEIAARVGYLDPFHFSRVFKTFNNVSPSGYRERAAGRLPKISS
jgi:AraC family transcriptional regulator, arabinose operon regulatory protein